MTLLLGRLEIKNRPMEVKEMPSFLHDAWKSETPGTDLLTCPQLMDGSVHGKYTVSRKTCQLIFALCLSNINRFQ